MSPAPSDRAPPGAAPLPPDDGPVPFTVRRPVEKLSRNAPCHCGSGKKYKKCCLEKDEARRADPSPYAGLTMEEAKRDPARHGDPGIFLDMTREELDATDRKTLSPALLLGLFEGYVARGALAPAAEVIDALSARGGDAAKDAPHLRDVLCYQALVAGDLKFARAALKHREGPATFEAQLNQLIVDLSTGKLPDKTARLEALLRALLDDPIGLADLADALSLSGLPGLALVVTRAAAAIRGGNADKLVLEDLLFAERERLKLDSDDPALWLLDRLAGATGGPSGGAGPVRSPPRRRGADEIAALQQTLIERESTIQKMRAERDRLAGELSRSRIEEAARTHAAAAAPVESEDARRLRRKVEELQAELREKQQERLDLQRRLRASEESEGPARESASAANAVSTSEPAGDAAPGAAAAADGEPAEPGEAQLRPLRFTETFYESAEGAFDRRLLLRAQEVAVRFASLDPATWKQAKKMQDLDDVYTLRVGIHHRLFVVRREGEIAVRELVTREGFDRALKRYRRHEF